MTQAAPKFIAMGGSLRQGAFTYQALNYAVAQFKELGIDVEVLDLRELPLPFCQGPGNQDPQLQANVKKLQDLFVAADGVILATPEYHGGISGVLKNALDLMSFDHLAGKVYGGISVLGGIGNNNALNQLRTHIRWVHGFSIPEQIAIGQAYQAFDDNGNIKDEKLQQRFVKFAKSLVRTTCKLRGFEVPTNVAE